LATRNSVYLKNIKSDIAIQARVKATLPKAVAEATGIPEHSPDSHKGVNMTGSGARAFTGGICDRCGYQSKKWIKNDRCMSKVDCMYRSTHPETNVLPYWYQYGEHIPMMLAEKMEESNKSQAWTAEEIDNQIEYITERFDLNG